MQSQHVMKVFYGFMLAAVLALGPPVAFLMIPGAGFFLLLLPIWSMGVICLLFLGLLISGRIPHAIGVALLAFGAALSPLGMLGVSSAGVVGQTIKTNNFILRELNEKCATNLVVLEKASAKYELIVLDNIDTRGEQNYDIADTVAVLTGMRVVEIHRTGHELKFYEAWETVAEHSSSCVGERDSPKVDRSPRGSQRSIAPLAVDVCLRRTKIPDPSGDQTPAIVLRSNPSVAVYCNVTEVVERGQTKDVDLGRVHYDSYQQRFFPDLAVPKGVPKSNWLLVLLSGVLEQDLSDKALLTHAVKTKK